LTKVVSLSPHDLRHRFGYMLAQTVPLHRLAQLMGHDSLDTTAMYVHGTLQDLQQAVEQRTWTYGVTVSATLSVLCCPW